ncbi:hypothetical protein GCM10010252_19690 [Streptomyces aureoverticillatus]|nr:hypothetical protein GCM10010252_19690 [Streptomyces aureoverticillatus]
MKTLGRTLAIAAASAATAAGVLAAPANAQEPQPPKELGSVSEWGMAKITIDAKSAQGTHQKDVGGGTWTYGYKLTSGGKKCFSYYFHGSKYHSSTAKIADGKDVDVEQPGRTSKANLTAGAAYTCYTYWSKS